MALRIPTWIRNLGQDIAQGGFNASMTDLDMVRVSNAMNYADLDNLVQAKSGEVVDS